ncbi:MAG: tocopherol cyclase family protein [Candidatus Thorarchaeota archaeon]
MEKDWGTGFPEVWIWLESNHFEEKGVSFTCSIAKIPWLGSSFAGYPATVCNL